jgi:hypothetical protein
MIIESHLPQIAAQYLEQHHGDRIEASISLSEFLSQWYMFLGQEIDQVQVDKQAAQLIGGLS